MQWLVVMPFTALGFYQDCEFLCQADLEIKLQQSLDAMQNRGDKTNALLKEGEAAQIAIDEASSINNETPVPVEDTEKIEALGFFDSSGKIEALASEVEKLKVTLLRCNVTPSRCLLF